jgi:ribonuclease BN (tRNA processing enzyme)
MWLEVFLIEYGFVESLEFTFVDADELLNNENHWLASFFQKELNIKVQTVQVIHSFPAYGIIIKSNDNDNKWKLVYSGDTRPSEDLILFGKDATVLIHEANHEKDMASKALTDRHCTTEEAISVGRR